LGQQVKRPIEPYRGHLSPKQIAHGMNAAGRNAKRLLKDATLLIEAKRFPTACSLAILSIEESGKLSILRSIATAHSEKELRRGWTEYRDHRMKNAMWIIADLVTKGARALDDLKPIFDSESDHPAILDTVKQIGFYTDCNGQGHWSEPDSVVDERLAQNMLVIAEILMPKHETTEREVELWIAHVGPHWGTPEMKKGAVEFYKAMLREGLTEHRIEEVEQFFGTTLKRTEH
jgi:AbiV family abortive infection protein